MKLSASNQMLLNTVQQYISQQLVVSLFIWFPGRVLLNIGKPSSDKCITTFDEVLGNVNILSELFTASKMFIKGLKLHYLEVWDTQQKWRHTSGGFGSVINWYCQLGLFVCNSPGEQRGDGDLEQGNSLPSTVNTVMCCLWKF